MNPSEPIDGVFTDLGTATMEPPAWIIRDLLPVGLTFVGAPPKAGKSTFTLAISLLVAGYESKVLPRRFNKVARTGPVLIFSAEATAGELRHTIEYSMGIPIEANEAILVCDDPFDWRLDDPNGLTKLLFWLEERKPLLLIIDPLRDFHAFDEKESGDMNRLLRPVQQWARREQSSVVIVHHSKKPSEEGKSKYNPHDLRGSGALFGLADAVLMFSPGKGDGEYLISSTFKRAKAWERTIRPAIYGFKGEEAIEVLTNWDERVLKAWNADIRSAQGIASAIGLPIPEVRESLGKLSDMEMIR